MNYGHGGGHGLGREHAARSGRNLGRETEAEKETEEENHLASRRQRRESQSVARKHREAAEREGEEGRPDFIMERVV